MHALVHAARTRAIAPAYAQTDRERERARARERERERESEQARERKTKLTADSINEKICMSLMHSLLFDLRVDINSFTSI